MTTKDYLEDYAELWRFAITNPDSIGNDKRWERMQEIIKELEASIRKEVEDGLIKYVDNHTEDKDFNRIWLKAHINLGMESLSKGITLK